MQYAIARLVQISRTNLRLFRVISVLPLAGLMFRDFGYWMTLAKYYTRVVCEGRANDVELQS